MKSVVRNSISWGIGAVVLTATMFSLNSCTNHSDGEEVADSQNDNKPETISLKFTEGQNLVPICEAKGFIDERQVQINNVENYIQLVCDCENLDVGSHKDERRFLCELLGSNANLFSPKSFLIPADDMIRAFEFEVAEGTIYNPYARAYLGSGESGDSTHLYFSEGVSSTEDIPIEVEGNYYLADLTYPCPASCPEKDALSYCEE